MKGANLILLFSLLGTFAIPLKAQPLVQELGGGVGLQGVTYIDVDATNDRLLFCGWFAYANDQPVSPGVLEWNESGLHSLGCGVEWDCISPGSMAGLANPIRTVTTWNGEVYLGGDIFFERNGYSYSGLMRWDGTEWFPVGTLDGRVTSLKVINGELIAAGWFTYADSLLVNGLARWDGENWREVHPVPPFYIGGGPNQIQDVELYNGELYIGGILPTIHDLAKWNGTTWETVGGGFGGGFSQINKLRIHDDRLYVAGSFARCPPLGNGFNPGNGIVAWNGAAWDDLGGGTCGANNGAINSMTWWNDELYVTGLFNRIGGVEGSRLAKWDGAQWCMLTPTGFWGNGGPGALAVYHDSLYIGGAFIEAGGEDVSCFGKWVGGDQTFGCGALAVGDTDWDRNPFTVFPNPGSNVISFSGIPSGTKLILFHDALGREVFRSSAPMNSMDIGQLASGAYSVTAIGPTGLSIASTRFVKY